MKLFHLFFVPQKIINFVYLFIFLQLYITFPQLDLYIVVVYGYECSLQQNLEQMSWRSFLNYEKYNFLKQKLELVWSRMRNTSIIIKFGEICVSLASFGDKLKVAHFWGGLRPERGFERNILKIDEKINEIQGYTITNTSPFFLRNLQKCYITMQQTTSNHFSVMSNNKTTFNIQTTFEQIFTQHYNIVLHQGQYFHIKQDVRKQLQ
ncbi:Hypothetical_protein [Hexamita inflata]|uniref:Hypothetical_protein n=1 Tax=Hexamita inflata TaxID=28002 RepID=A0AA86QEM7_9EUKA|nr:Hypothetical protein HINF_LOCUS45529 [Hexamita inflata]